MTIQYQDFFPQVIEPGFFSNTYEELPILVARINEWVTDNDIRVVNVETLLLPNVQTQIDLAKAEHYTHGEMPASWRQFLRVWFEWKS